MAQTMQIPETQLGPDMTEQEFRNWLTKQNIAESAIKIIIEDQKLTVADLLNDVSWPDARLAKMHTLLNIPIGYTAKLEGAIKMTKKVLQENKTKDRVGKIIRAIKEGNFSTDDIKQIVDAIQQGDEHPIIEHPFDRRFSFPVVFGITPPAPWRELEHPPFLNRQQAILRLLMDCYSSYFYKFDSNVKVYNANVPIKPVAALLGAAPGYGKTRLLLEWAIRAFHDKDVLFTFLTENREITTEQHTDVEIKTFAGEFNELADKFQVPGKNNSESKARFLCTLHQTLHKSAVISASMANIYIDTNKTRETVVDEVCRKILAWGICSHFKFKNVSLHGKSMTFPGRFDVSQNEDHEFLKDNGLLQKLGENSTFFSMFKLFMDLMEEKKVNNIGQTGDYPLFLINIDEAQALVDITAYNQTLAFEVIKRFYEVPTRLDARVFVFMTGLATKSAELLSDATQLLVDVSLPLNPLLQPDYCAKVMQIYENKFTRNKQFSEDGKTLIKLLWNRCLGIPRALQLLHGVILKYSATLGLKKITDDQCKTVLQDFCKSAKDYFGERGAVDYTTFGVDKTKWDIFTTECCLGVARRPTENFSETMTYSDLERKGTIFPIKFYTVQGEGQYRQYTMPFLFFSSLLKKEITYLKAFKELEKVTIIPTIGDIVGNDGSKSIHEQGNSLEHACATSLWARYKLVAKEGELIKLQTLIPSWPIDDHYASLLVSHASILTCCQVCFDGVGDCEEEIAASDLLHPKRLLKLLSSQYIIINKPRSKFADVLVPVLVLNDSEAEQIKTGSTALQDCWKSHGKFLLVQCHNVERGSSLMSPTSIASALIEQKLTELLHQNHFLVLMSPNNTYHQALWQRAKVGSKQAETLAQHKDNIIETSGKDWLSELFLVINTNDEHSSDATDTIEMNELSPEETVTDSTIDVGEQHQFVAQRTRSLTKRNRPYNDDEDKEEQCEADLKRDAKRAKKNIK